MRRDLKNRLARLEGSVPPPEAERMDPRVAEAVLAVGGAACPDWKPGDESPHPACLAALERVAPRLVKAEAAGRIDEELTAVYAEIGLTYDPTPYRDRER